MGIGIHNLTRALNSFNALLGQLSRAQLKAITDAMATIAILGPSLKNLIDLSTIMMPLTVMTYVGKTILDSVLEFTNSKDDPQLTERVKTLTRHMSSITLKQRSAQTLMFYHAFVEPLNEDELALVTQTKDEAVFVLKNLMQPATHRKLAHLKKMCLALLEESYEEMTPDIDSTLDGLDAKDHCYSAQKHLFSYAKSWRYNGLKEPTYDPDNLNYAQIRSMYRKENEDRVGALMVKMRIEFEEQGGRRIFASIVNSWKDASKVFEDIFNVLANRTNDRIRERGITLSDLKRRLPSSWGPDIDSLCASFDERIAIANEKWLESPPDDESSSGADTRSAFIRLPPDTGISKEQLDIIACRGFLDFQRHYYPWTLFRRRFLEDIRNGLLDVPRVIWGGLWGILGGLWGAAQSLWYSSSKETAFRNACILAGKGIFDLYNVNKSKMILACFHNLFLAIYNRPLRAIAGPIECGAIVKLTTSHLSLFYAATPAKTAVSAKASSSSQVAAESICCSLGAASTELRTAGTDGINPGIRQ